MAEMNLPVKALFEKNACGTCKDNIKKRCIFMHSNDEFLQAFCSAFLDPFAAQRNIDRGYNYTRLEEIDDTLTFKRCQACLDEETRQKESKAATRQLKWCQACGGGGYKWEGEPYPPELCPECKGMGMKKLTEKESEE